MKKFFLLIAVLSFTAGLVPAFAQEPQEPNIPDMAAKQTESMSNMLKLEYYQEFLVDSVLQYNYQQMLDELNLAKKGGASNSESYQVISDKWMDACDKAYEKIFTPEQWAKYLKSQYGKEKKKRDKRISDRVVCK